MKGGLSGASSDLAPSSANGRLAWVQAARVLRGPSQALLPWPRGRRMQEIFNSAPTSSLPSFDRAFLSDIIPEAPQTVEPAPKIRKIASLPVARGRATGDRAEGANLHSKLVKEWLG
eukprot:2312894-Amphidinium_carterae.1